MSNLSGLPLRREACMALGYTSRPAYGRQDYEWWNSSEQIEANFACHGIENLPAIESDPAVAIPTATEFARKHELEITVGVYLDGTSDCAFYKMRQGHAVKVALGEGDNPCEAIARAIVKASEQRVIGADREKES